MLTILENDRLFARDLPKYTVVTASAGSGKTRALKQRFVQLLLSKAIPNNNLKNILAITFTNNAAREMKQRVLDALKSASLGKPEILAEFQPLLSLSPSELPLEAGRQVDEILENYSDFQIQTIDSFLARVFKASAPELGLSPDLEIVLDSDALLDEAFSLFARELSEGTKSAQLLHQLIGLLLESRGADDRFLWNPYPELAEKVKDLYRKIILTSRQLRREDYSADIRKLGDQLIQKVKDLDALVSAPGLVKSKRFEDYVGYARNQDVGGLLSHKSPSSPITKSGSKPGEYERALRRCEPLCGEIETIRSRLIVLRARQHFQPYAEAHALLSRWIEAVKHDGNQIDIGDIVKKLAEYLKPGIVPEIYYSLGETLCHYLIDEFQDTNPIQWETLEPLVGNALAMKGSLFVVGDMKQSIYGFRGADWRIMKRLQSEDVFPSAKKDHLSLTTNFRSYEKILHFSEDVFKKIIPGKVIEGAAEASGLATDEQRVRDTFKGKGYVELSTVPVDSAPVNPEQAAQKQKLLDIVSDCLARGYRASDITILSPRNSDIIEVSGWLNELGISFISHSSLDVRTRKVTGELLTLLQFLDSPIDDLSFAAFLLSETFEQLLQRSKLAVPRQKLLQFLFEHRLTRRNDHPLYVFFRQTYPDLWKTYFEDLFNIVGYLPVYDLISEVYKVFGMFSLLPDEEATLVKILEVVKDFEEKGENSLKGFLRYAEDSSEDADWDIDIPTDINAVKVMTIHKAKGLESKVVVVLLYDSLPHRESLYLQPEGDEVRLVRLTKGLAEEAEELSELYHKKELVEVVDDLNKLYVAFTRAEEEMYIISVKARRATIPSAFLPESGYEPQRKPAVKRITAAVERNVELLHDSPRSAIRRTDYTRIAIRETRRGEFIHAVLEAIDFEDDHLGMRLEEAMSRAQIRLASDTEPSRLRDALTRVLHLAEIQPLFIRKSGRTVFNEQEFADHNGALVRMDRVVLDPDIVTVIDYKTGDEKSEYTDQVKKYMAILKEFYQGRTVQGFLVYIDRTSAHAVS